MIIDKFGPPEIAGVDTRFDIYFRLDKSEADSVSNPVTQAMIAAALTEAGGPYGAAAAAMIGSYLGQIAAHTGPTGCSVKLTVQSGLHGVMQMKEFIAEPI